MLSPRFSDLARLRKFRQGSVLLVLPLLLGLFLQTFGTAHAEAAGSIEIDKDSGPTGSYITVTGTNIKNCLGGDGCVIYLFQGGDYMDIGYTQVDTNFNFTWTGVLPRAGGFNDGEDKKKSVSTGDLFFGVGENPSQLSTMQTADFTVTDNTQGPTVSWDAIFQTGRLWHYYDAVIVQNVVSRSWFWGPTLLYDGYEPYKDSPEGWRYVRYYDKARMEVNDYKNDPYNNPYYISNGLIVKEMVTNQIQLGDNTFQENTGSPDVLPAGDLTSANQTPPYRVYQAVLNTNDNDDGGVVNEFFSRTGEVNTNATYNKYHVTAGHKVDQTGHFIASPFWTYLNSTGPTEDIYAKPKTVRLFDPLFSATGLPITEPYWTTTMVGGVNNDVLVQLFERRVLTYTPSNSPAYQVEMGNVGLQYYQWRYGTK